MGVRKFLTKSKFKVGLSCPRKLFYLDKAKEYADNKLDDPFLEALARGGYQVGELAKIEYSTGTEVTEREHLAAAQRTKDLLKQESCIIFEAAFFFPPFFVRSDIVVKNGNHIKLIEVKSKSIDPTDFRNEIWNSRAGKGIQRLKSSWYEYIYDLAFQTWVARQAYPEFNFISIFKAVDKTKSATVDGLNSVFLIKKTEGKGFSVEPQGQLSKERLGASILTEVDLTDAVNDIIAGKEQTEFTIKKPFAELARDLARIYLTNEAFPSKNAVGSQCKGCEFRTDHPQLKSGFNECWIESQKVDAKQITEPFVFDVGRFTKSDELFADGIYLIKNMNPNDVKQSKDNGKSGLLQSDRQKIQIASIINKSTAPTFQLEELSHEMGSWKYPYHFIDFETCAPALPFTKGRRPYENVAFQFSHHILYENGKIEHAGQYINLTPGEFPNFEFVRNLKEQLQKDDGTIFRYSHHENTILNQIIIQLTESQEPDRNELIEFIRTITNYLPEGTKEKIKGPREMVDLCEMVLRFYYSPRMGGSASIKYVLPAILNESDFLKDKYSRPIYGTEQLPSLNFRKQKWVNITDSDEVTNPYSELPKIFEPEDLKRIETFLIEDDDVRNGGAAMMAYCMSQFTKMTELERERIRNALLRYCELDTLAMVMIVEYWKDHLVRSYPSELLVKKQNTNRKK